MFINVNNDYFNLDNIKGFKIIEPMKIKLYFIDGTAKTCENINRRFVDDFISLTLGEAEEY